jgi:signal transduction histidine kinase
MREGRPLSPPAEDLFAGGGEMGERMRVLDWSSTPIGPVETWPRSLRTIVRIMLTSRHAMWMGWGPELTFFYNDAYRPTLGIKHAWALGARATAVWAEIWPDIGPRAEVVMRTGTATWDEGLLLFLERSGEAEETYHTFSYSPVPDDQGRVGGLLCVVTEVTERTLGERRLALLRELAAGLAATHTEAEVFDVLGEQARAEPRDLPFALTYLFDADAQRARLVSAIGVAAGERMAPERIELSSRDAPWPAEDVHARGAPVLIGELAARFDALPVGPWDKPPRGAAVIPIAQQGQPRPAGFLVVGVSPYRPFDAAYAGFLDLLAGQIAAGLASARAYEAERRRAEALAEIDRARTAFFSSVSHELRTPLTLILGPVSDALASQERVLGGEELDLVHRNTLRLLELVNALLDFSRIEAGRARAPYEPTDLVTLTAELESVFRAAIERAGGALAAAPAPSANRRGALEAERGRRVLVVDDNADMREYIEHLLGRHWAVEAFADGLDALEAARREPPDLVVTDVMMPTLDGFGLLHELRADPATRAIPVIMLSARSGEESRVEGLRAGADDYLVKPFASRELVARVTTHLQLAALRRAAEDAARERERLLVREQEARREAEAANRAKDEFLAMLGHELRNPLAPITTALYLMRLRHQGIAEKERGVIERQVEHLVRLVDDLLDVSRLTQGKVELRRQRVEVSEIVAKAIETASPLLEQHGHHLAVDVPPSGLAVDGDVTRLGQVIANLLINAAKYTRSGGRIAVEGARRGAEIVLAVRDDGIGIDREMLPKIFDLFMQERQALDRSQGGLGLGLAIVRSLIAMHGGSVSAHSAGRGHGSEFTVRLPAAVLQVAEDDAGGAAPAEEPASAKGAADALRILVVDDNTDAAVVLAEWLSAVGHTTRIAHDGPSALRIAQELEPDVAVVDIGLPVMDGYELARRLRALPALERLHLIAVTGYGQSEDRLRSREAGFDEHLVKPIQPEHLAPLLCERRAGGPASATRVHPSEEPLAWTDRVS